MKTLLIETTRPYPVTVGADLSRQIAAHFHGGKVAIISDSNVWPLYGDQLECWLQEAGLSPCHFVFPAGENSKNLQQFSQILHFLAENQLTRQDHILALGGGVTGDLAGFSAACYLRGIPYVQVPTTLLSMVDASVGGKTGIDLPAGKNLCGAFYQPEAVFCDTNYPLTLPEPVFLDGCAEVIKYAILFDPELFSQLEHSGIEFDRESVIFRCIDWKRQTIMQDETDQGVRKLLNFGHTVGHAAEKCSQFSLSHGKAVAMGMATLVRAVNCPDAERILTLLKHFCLPVQCPYSATELFDAAMADKKRTGNAVDLILPDRIGQCRITPTSLTDFKTLLQEGLKHGHHSTALHPEG